MAEVAQEDGAYPRINGGMLQSQQFTGMIISAVGYIVGPNTMQAADGTNITLDTDNIAEALVVNPEMCVEIIGSAQDATTIAVCTNPVSPLALSSQMTHFSFSLYFSQAFVSRELGTDMDLGLYNKMIMVQQSHLYAHYFQDPVASHWAFIRENDETMICAFRELPSKERLSASVINK